MWILLVALYGILKGARDVMKKKAINYLLKYYPAWTVDSVTYDKWGFFNGKNE